MEMEQDTKKFITVKEAAKMLGVTPLTLRNWDKKGKLLAGRHPFNNYRVYAREDIDKILVEIATSKEKQPARTARPPKNKVRKLEVMHL
jgi:excisionase family DNA binding protein